jgi:SAM-dependent methyltransferase
LASDRRRYDPPVTEPELPEHVARNRVYWDEVNAPLYAAPGARAWARQEITWGIFGIPEDELHALPADVAGMDVVELGCGTAYFGAWLARRGARVTGIDNSAEQLKTARRLQVEHDLHFPLIHGKRRGHRPARCLLRPGHQRVRCRHLGGSVSLDPRGGAYPAPWWRARLPRQRHVLGTDGPETDDQGPAADRLLRPYFGMHRFDWAGQPGVEFHLGYGDWIRLLRASGFEVLDLLEIRAPDDLAELRGDGLVDPDWARKWPAEQIWRVCKMDRY